MIYCRRRSAASCGWPLVTTAHFVRDRLGERPIIVQQIIPVDHMHAASDLAQAGHDIEQFALSRALKLEFVDRVFLCGNRTVIFD
jgi:formyltetrahydrofolate deformylase